MKLLFKSVRCSNIFTELRVGKTITNYCLIISSSQRDIAPEGADLAETNKSLDEMSDLALELQQKTGVKLLWVTCNLFANPR